MTQTHERERGELSPSTAAVPREAGYQDALTRVVVHAESAVIEEAAQRVALSDSVGERGGNGAADAAHATEDALGPGEEFVEHRSRDALPPLMALLGSEMGPVLFKLEEGSYPNGLREEDAPTKELELALQLVVGVSKLVALGGDRDERRARLRERRLKLYDSTKSDFKLSMRRGIDGHAHS